MDVYLYVSSGVDAEYVLLDSLCIACYENLRLASLLLRKSHIKKYLVMDLAANCVFKYVMFASNKSMHFTVVLIILFICYLQFACCLGDPWKRLCKIL